MRGSRQFNRRYRSHRCSPRHAKTAAMPLKAGRQSARMARGFRIHMTCSLSSRFRRSQLSLRFAHDVCCQLVFCASRALVNKASASRARFRVSPSRHRHRHSSMCRYAWMGEARLPPPHVNTARRSATSAEAATQFCRRTTNSAPGCCCFVLSHFRAASVSWTVVGIVRSTRAISCGSENS